MDRNQQKVESSSDAATNDTDLDESSAAEVESDTVSSASLPGKTDLSVVESRYDHYFRSVARIGVQTADALYGTAQNAGFKPIVPFMSFAFGAWALLLLLFFYRRYDREVEMATKVAGVIVSAVAIVKYDLIIAILNRLLGSGAGMTSVILLVVLTVLGIVALLMPLLFGSRSDGEPV